MKRCIPWIRKSTLWLLFPVFVITLAGFHLPGDDGGAMKDLKQEIKHLIQSKKADVGVAIAGPGATDTMSINGHKRYTIMSVVKFPQAMAVLDLVDKGKLALDQDVSFSAANMRQGTYSTLRDEQAGERTLTLKECLSYSVGKSDNIVCDKLFSLSGGPAATEAYLHKLGVRETGIGTTYAGMVENTIHANWSSPLAMAVALEKFYGKETLSEQSHEVLWKIMSESENPRNRIMGLLPEGTVVAHKTGTMFTDDNPVLDVVNDVGIVMLPDGRHFSIVVYVSNSGESAEDTFRLIAEITRVAWDHFSEQQ